MSQALIPPTVGRVVWFYPSRLTGEAGFAPASGTNPLAAVIAHVWSETLVNLAVFDANGKTHSRTSVNLIHEEIEGDWPANDFCTWMPFQKGQAKAQEALKKPFDRLSFGAALDQLKAGARVARAGWNGKGQFVYLVPPASYAVQTGAAKAHFGEGSMVPYNAYLALKTVDESVSTWAPSVSDCLAEDWLVVAA